MHVDILSRTTVTSCSQHIHSASALNPDCSQHKERRAVSQYMVFEKKVTDISF